MSMARAAKVAAVGVAWGYHEVQELDGAGAAAMVGEFGQLLPTLARL
jgi:phosphoglycolate phosphatase